MEPTSQPNQEDQINAAVVGRGVRLHMGKRIDGLNTAGMDSRGKIVPPSAVVPPPVIEPMSSSTHDSEPVKRDLDAQAGDPLDFGSEGVGLMEDAVLISTMKQKRVRKTSLRPLNQNVKLAIGGIALLAAGYFGGELLNQGSEQQRISHPTTAGVESVDAAAPMPIDPISPSVDAVTAVDATEQRNDGPLPAGLAMPASEAITMPSITQGAASSPKPSKVDGAKPQPDKSPASTTAVDKQNAAMNVPLGDGSDESSDISQLKEIADIASKQPPSARLAKPLEETKVAPAAMVPSQSLEKATSDDKRNEAKHLQPEGTVNAAAAKVSVGNEKSQSKASDANVESKPAVKQAQVKPETKKLENKQTKKSVEPKNSVKTQKPSQFGDDDLGSGFALPIREVYANGKPVTRAATPERTSATQLKLAEPRATTKQGKSTPDVMHVDVGYAVVANPASQLPMRVNVGDVLTNGAVVSGFDPVKGTIQTNRGSYGMK